MARGWMTVALTAAWLGLVGPATAEEPPAPGPASQPGPPAGPPPGPQAALGGSFMGLPCPPPMPAPAPCPCPPACEGPTDSTQFATPMYHVGFEYLLWYVRRTTVPPLATSGAVTDPIPGALGQPNTRALPGSTDPDDVRHHGGRLSLGIGIDASNEWSLMGSVFLLEQVASSRTYSSTGAPGTPVLARPFFDVANRVENADPVAIPGLASGILLIELRRRFYGADLNLRNEYLCSDNHRMHLLAGVKLLWLEESLGISAVSQDLPGLGAPGNNYFLSENVSLVNRFYGGQVGGEYEFRLGPIFLQTAGKLAFGVNNTRHRLSAFARIVEPSGIVTAANDRALYVTPANAGTFYKTRFSFAPEANLKVGFDFNDHVRVGVGYSLLYWTDVVRPGESIQRNVNIQPIGTSRIVNPPTAPSGQTTAFWAQGLDVSVRFSF